MYIKGSYETTSSSNNLLEYDSICPICKNFGEQVKNITVQSLLKENFKTDIDDLDYYICLTPTCNVVYFNNENKNIFYEHQITVPVHFKINAYPKYICYCNKITIDDIMQIIKKGAKNISDIMANIHVLKNRNCEKNNPLGRCCYQDINNLIKNHKKNND